MSSTIPARFPTGESRDPRADGVGAFSGHVSLGALAAPTSPAVSSNGVGLGRRTERLHVVEGRSGDHLDIHQMLLAIYHAPSAVEFQSSQDDPFYEPSDRLLIKRGKRILSHVQLINREMRFGAMITGVTEFDRLTTWPEYRGQGHATRLLLAAERKSQDSGSSMAWLRTSLPTFFESRGWCACAQPCFSLASPRDILSYLEREQEDSQSDDSPIFNSKQDLLNIRLWRHVEQAALMRLYEEGCQTSYGSLVRSDAYWRWLSSRRAYDRIYVAIDGPDKIDLDKVSESIVGYAVMNRERIVELQVDQDHPTAARQLISRACGDAIERDFHTVRLDAPADHPMHDVFRNSAGKFFDDEIGGEQTELVKLFDPTGFLRRLCRELHARAKRASLARPCELGLRLNDEKHLLVFGPRSVKLVPGRLGRSYLACTGSEVTRLLLGRLDVHRAVKVGRIEASTMVARELAAVVFPRLPFWRPPLDRLPA